MPSIKRFEKGKKKTLSIKRNQKLESWVHALRICSCRLDSENALSRAIRESTLPKMECADVADG